MEMYRCSKSEYEITYEIWRWWTINKAIDDCKRVNTDDNDGKGLWYLRTNHKIKLFQSIAISYYCLVYKATTTLTNTWLNLNTMLIGCFSSIDNNLQMTDLNRSTINLESSIVHKAIYGKKWIISFDIKSTPWWNILTDIISQNKAFTAGGSDATTTSV